MHIDSKIFFATLNLPANPIRPGISWPEAAGRPNEIKRVDSTALLPEILDVFVSLELTVDILLLWIWKRQSDSDFYEIHTDGHISKPHRFMALNWLIEGTSNVEWFSFNNAVAVERKYGFPTSYPITDWSYASKPSPLAHWNGSKPAIVNIEQPHQVKVLGDGNVPRKSVSIRFLPNIRIEDMIEKCSTRILGINQN